MSTGSYPGLTEPRIGALLRLASEATHRVLLQRLHAAGFDDVRASHFELFRFPGPEGMHPTELADHVGLSKQALNHLLNELESLGYLTRETTSTDGRHRVVRLTDRGLAFAAAVKAVVLAIEDELTMIFGERHMTRLKADLTAIPAELKAAEGTINNLVPTTCGEVQQQMQQPRRTRPPLCDRHSPLIRINGDCNLNGVTPETGETPYD
jgi:DNA-binding MarR family transcriptional regulator